MRLIDADELKKYISQAVKAQEGKDVDLIPVGELPIVIDKQPVISEREIRDKVIKEFTERLNNKITEFVLQHKDNLDFASGIAVSWNIVDEIAEQMMRE